jgi:hypothetical protein
MKVLEKNWGRIFLDSSQEADFTLYRNNISLIKIGLQGEALECDSLGQRLSTAFCKFVYYPLR